jgi:hypothetical protein
MRVMIANTNQPLLAKIQKVAGIGAIVVKKSTDARWKDSAWWTCNAEAAEHVLKQIRPYMWMKTEQADLALETQERLRDPKLKADRAWQAEYVARMKAMNARGPSKESS